MLKVICTHYCGLALITVVLHSNTVVMFTDIQGCVVVMNLALYYVFLLGHLSCDFFFFLPFLKRGGGGQRRRKKRGGGGGGGGEGRGKGNQKKRKKERKKKKKANCRMGLNPRMHILKIQGRIPIFFTD